MSRRAVPLPIAAVAVAAVGVVGATTLSVAGWSLYARDSEASGPFAALRSPAPVEVPAIPGSATTAAPRPASDPTRTSAPPDVRTTGAPLATASTTPSRVSGAARPSLSHPRIGARAVALSAESWTDCGPNGPRDAGNGPGRAPATATSGSTASWHPVASRRAVRPGFRAVPTTEPTTTEPTEPTEPPTEPTEPPTEPTEPTEPPTEPTAPSDVPDPLGPAPDPEPALPPATAGERQESRSRRSRAPHP